MISLRLRVMQLLGFSADRLASETRGRSVRRDDVARTERLGPHDDAISNAREFAAALDEKARAVASS